VPSPYAGETLPKEQLLKTIWPDTFVSDEFLIRSISEIRRAFDDDPRSRSSFKPSQSAVTAWSPRGG